MPAGRLPSVGEAFERAPSCNLSLLALSDSPLHWPPEHAVSSSVLGPTPNAHTRNNRRPLTCARSHIRLIAGGGHESDPTRVTASYCGRHQVARTDTTTWFRSQDSGADFRAPVTSERSRQQPQAVVSRPAARSRFDGRQEHRTVGTCSEASEIGRTARTSRGLNGDPSDPSAVHCSGRECSRWTRDRTRRTRRWGRPEVAAAVEA